MALFLLHRKKNRGATWCIRKVIILEAEKSGLYNWSCQKLVLYDIWLNVLHNKLQDTHPHPHIREVVLRSHVTESFFDSLLSVSQKTQPLYKPLIEVKKRKWRIHYCVERTDGEPSPFPSCSSKEIADQGKQDNGMLL